MNHLPHEQLRRSLRKQGLSRTYVSQLIGELRDHFECLIGESESSPNGDSLDRATARLGSDDEILQAVLSRPELRSWPNRFPVLTFVACPAILLCLSSVVMMLAGDLVVDVSRGSSTTFGPTWASGFLVLQTAMPAALTVLFLMVAIRNHICWVLPMTSAFLFSFSGWSAVDLVHCQLSNSTIGFHHWQFDLARFLAAPTTCLCGLLCVGGLRCIRRHGDAAQGLSWRCSARGIALALSTVALSALGYVLINDRALEIVKEHSIDPIAAHLDSRPNRASMTLQALGSDEVRRDLNIEEGTLQQLHRLLQDFEVRRKQIWEQWREENPDIKWPQPLDPEDLSPALINTAEQALSLLDEQQKRRLRQIVYQHFGTDVLLLSEVQQTLRLRVSQIEEIKDAKVERINKNNRLTSEYRRAPEEKREPILQAIRQHTLAANKQLASVLSARQREQLQRIQGAPLDPSTIWLRESKAGDQ